MKRLLSIELQKIWKNRASRLLTIGYFLILSFIALIASIKITVGSFNIHFAEMGIFNFPFIWHFNTWIASLLKFFFAIVIVSMISNEYTFGTLKQNLIDGLSKREFIYSKALTVILFALLSTVFIFLLSLILGYSFSSYTELKIIFSEMNYLLAYFVKLVGFFSFCLLLGVLVKRSAFALGFLFLWFLVEKISYGIFKFEVFPNNDKVDAVYRFFPLESMGNLVVEPFTRLSVIKSIKSTIGDSSIKDYSIHFSSILIVALWSILFIYLSYLIIKKRDL